MQARLLWLTLTACVAAFLSLSAPASAAEILYDGTGFLKGQQSFDQSFNLSGPGTLSITLSNVDWPQPLLALNLLVSSSSGTLGPEMGAGTSTFQITGGTIFAQWFGTAQGPLNLGVYSLEIVWSPAVATPVPLPASLILLLSGLCLLALSRLKVRGRVRHLNPLGI